MTSKTLFFLDDPEFLKKSGVEFDYIYEILAKAKKIPCLYSRKQQPLSAHNSSDSDDSGGSSSDSGSSSSDSGSSSSDSGEEDDSGSDIPSSSEIPSQERSILSTVYTMEKKEIETEEDSERETYKITRAQGLSSFSSSEERANKTDRLSVTRTDKSSSGDTDSGTYSDSSSGFEITFENIKNSRVPASRKTVNKQRPKKYRKKQKVEKRTWREVYVKKEEKSVVVPPAKRAKTRTEPIEESSSESGYEELYNNIVTKNKKKENPDTDLSIPFEETNGYKSLYDYQKVAVDWAYKRHKSLILHGGLCGDDMGLGKTRMFSLLIQRVAREPVNHPMLFAIAAPSAMLSTWRDTLKEHAPSITDILTYENPKETDRLLKKYFYRDNHTKFPNARVVILLSHKLMVNRLPKFQELGFAIGTGESLEKRDRSYNRSGYDVESENWKDAVFQIMVIDEAHKVRGSAKEKKLTQTKEACIKYTPRSRFGLTGTVVENDAIDWYKTYDIIFPNDQIFGDYAMFTKTYAGYIRKSQKSTSSIEDRQRACQVTDLLKEKFNPFFIRRTKSEVETSLSALKKVDIVVWIQLTAPQQTFYKVYVQSEKDWGIYHELKKGVDFSSSEINGHRLSLQKRMTQICIHPFLTECYEEQEGVPREEEDDEEMGESQSSEERQVQDGRIQNTEIVPAKDPKKKKSRKILRPLPPTDEILRKGAKIKAAIDMIKMFSDQGDKSVLFSQSKVALLMIHQALGDTYGIKSVLYHGDIKSGRERDEAIYKLSNDDSIRALLGTTRSGGIGITLTAANRVIILDPDWNPTSDQQASDRCYRLGQTKDVYVYRLISCATIEEKIFNTQIYKSGMSNLTMKKKSEVVVHGNNTATDLNELLQVRDDMSYSDAHTKLKEAYTNEEDCPLYSKQKEILASVEHVKHFNNFSILFGEKAKEVVRSDGTTIEEPVLLKPFSEIIRSRVPSKMILDFLDELEEDIDQYPTSEEDEISDFTSDEEREKQRRESYKFVIDDRSIERHRQRMPRTPRRHELQFTRAPRELDSRAPRTPGEDDVCYAEIEPFVPQSESNDSEIVIID